MKMTEEEWNKAFQAKPPKGGSAKIASEPILIPKGQEDKLFPVTTPFAENVTLGELMKNAKYRNESYEIKITPNYVEVSRQERYDE